VAEAINRVAWSKKRLSVLGAAAIVAVGAGIVQQQRQRTPLAPAALSAALAACEDANPKTTTLR
jgi:hypothetical protein